MPATKAPSAVCTPISSVVSAIASMITRMAVITGTSIDRWSLTHTMRRATSRRPTMKLASRNSAVSPRLSPTCCSSTVSWTAMPEMTAMMIQASVSSRIAVARISWPRSRRSAPVSSSTMATILTDEIDSAVPRNSAVMSRPVFEGIVVDGIRSAGMA
jgi:hypothetical protein